MYIYNIFGSHDSTDIDAVVYLDELPVLIEDRKKLSTKIGQELGENYNVIIAKVKHGIIVDCTYPKASPDSLNNAVLATYNNHQQIHPRLVERKVVRNEILAIYKTIRILSTYLTRTQFRTLIRPTINWRFDLKLKIQKLKCVDFGMIKEFNQVNMKDADIWKTFGFYVVQNYALLKYKIELYTKHELVKFEPRIEPFLYRYDRLDIDWFCKYVDDYLDLIETLPFKQEHNILSLNNQAANIEIEWPVQY